MIALSPPKNILVADPDRHRCINTAYLLKRLEYNSFIAVNIHDFILITNGILPNLILLDLRMPYIEGQTCIEKIRSDRRLSNIKVIVALERADEKYVDTLGKDADAYIFRPVSPTELYRDIHKLIEPHPREIPRLRVLFRTVITAGGTTKAYFATAISEKGIFIRTLKALPAGTRVRMTLDLPSPKPVVFDGEVLYELKRGKDDLNEPGMGIKFLDLSDETRSGLRKFIEDQLAGEHAPDVI